MIHRRTIAAVLLVSGALAGGCASSPMASLDPFLSIAIPAQERGTASQELRRVVPAHAPQSAGETI